MDQKNILPPSAQIIRAPGKFRSTQAVNVVDYDEISNCSKRMAIEGWRAAK